MCELFAISSSNPTNVKFSLNEFSRHGGLTGPHKDGWGIAFYADRDAQLIKEASSASQSECLSFVKNHHIQSKFVISHIRRATQGDVKLENTQPFCRELGGRMHVFAHNGDLTGIDSDENLKHSIFHSIGDTDSEYAFCSLMGMLKKLWIAKQHPTIEDRISAVFNFASLIKPYGPANFIYSDSELLFAHGHKRIHNSENEFRPPGLYFLSRACLIGMEANNDIVGLGIRSTQTELTVALIASVPLTMENWVPLGKGELVVLKNGTIIKWIKLGL